MQQFTQKYAIIQLFEDMPVGTQFSSNSWPLHATVVDTFAINWDVSGMTTKLDRLLTTYAPVRTIVGDDRFFGDQGQTRVSLLEKTDDLAKLHNDVIDVLEQGGWRPNDPQFAKEGFLPHTTVQSHGRLNKGDVVTFKALSIVDFSQMETRINVKYWLQSMFLRRRENHYYQVVLSILMEIKKLRRAEG